MRTHFSDLVRYEYSRQVNTSLQAHTIFLWITALIHWIGLLEKPNEFVKTYNRRCGGSTAASTPAKRRSQRRLEPNAVSSCWRRFWIGLWELSDSHQTACNVMSTNPYVIKNSMCRKIKAKFGTNFDKASSLIFRQCSSTTTPALFTRKSNG